MSRSRFQGGNVSEEYRTCGGPRSQRLRGNSVEPLFAEDPDKIYCRSASLTIVRPSEGVDRWEQLIARMYPNPIVPDVISAMFSRARASTL